MLPRPDVLDPLVREALRREWGIAAVELTALDQGMNSWTAGVRIPGADLVVKCVGREDAGALRTGAEISSTLTERGIIAGRPHRTIGGSCTLDQPWGSLCLMEHVPGRELTTSPEDQERMASVLAQIHRADHRGRRAAPFMADLGSGLRSDRLQSWVLPSIRGALRAFSHLLPTPWAVINTDPSLDSFRWDDSTGQVGVIDWAGASPGPVIYDVASAVMYLGGEDSARQFLDRYAEVGPLTEVELHSSLPVAGRFRAAVQADYFTRRILDEDLTGIDDPGENQKGLDDARRMFDGFGALVPDDPDDPAPTSPVEGKRSRD